MNMNPVKKITEGLSGFESAELLYENDKQLQDNVLFSPVLSDSEYTKAVSASKYGSQEIRKTANGKVELYAAAGVSMKDGIIGLRYQSFLGSTPYLFKAVFKITGLTNLPTEITPYFIYYVNGSRVIRIASVTVLSNDEYLYEYSITAQSDNFTVELFGPQVTSATTASIEGENSIVCEEVQIYKGLNAYTNNLQNELTDNIIAYFNSLGIPESLRLYSTVWRDDLYQNATPRPGNNGFTVPAGEKFNPSNTVVDFKIPDVTHETSVAIFFRMPADISGLSFFQLRYNPNASDGRYIENKTPRLIEGDLWAIEYTIAADPDNVGSFEFAIQQTGAGTYPEEFYIYWENVCFWQNYKYGKNGSKSFEQIAIENIVSNAVANASSNTVTEIIVSSDPDDNTAAFTGNNAIQLAINSITDATAAKRYRIFVKKGIYKVTNSSEFLGYPGYPAMIAMKDYIDVIGQSMDECIIWAELPYNDADIDTSIEHILHQTVWNFAKEVTIANLTLVAKNLRYVIHQDALGTRYSSRYYKNVSLQFIGEKGGLNAFGLGTWQGEENYVDGGKALTSSGAPFACHNNTNFDKRSIWSFKNFQFIRTIGEAAVNLHNCGSRVNDELRIEGCSFGGTGYVLAYTDLYLTNKNGNDYFNHADFRVYGYGNSPFLFTNTVNGEVLRIRTKTTGANNTVRFSKTSSAFDVLIRENKLSQNDIFIPNRGTVDGYIYQDGSAGLPGTAYGCKDVGYYNALYDDEVITSLGKRLGDCTTNTKNLVVSINGTNYTVVFNKNYTDMQNGPILAEINAVIGSVATADTYYYGREYYPLMPDVTEIVFNGSTSDHIPKGTVVKKINGRVYPCENTENIYGIALEDIPVFNNVQGVITGQGRIMKKGYIRTNTTEPHYVLSDKDGAAVVGDTFKVENGKLIADPLGTIKVFTANTVAINC